MTTMCCFHVGQGSSIIVSILHNHLGWKRPSRSWSSTILNWRCRSWPGSVSPRGYGYAYVLHVMEAAGDVDFLPLEVWVSFPVTGRVGGCGSSGPLPPGDSCIDTAGLKQLRSWKKHPLSVAPLSFYCRWKLIPSEDNAGLIQCLTAVQLFWPLRTAVHITLNVSLDPFWVLEGVEYFFFFLINSSGENVKWSTGLFVSCISDIFRKVSK